MAIAATGLIAAAAPATAADFYAVVRASLDHQTDGPLADCAWLAGDAYSIADAAFTPYVVRLDHLDVLGMLEPTPRVADWYRRIQARPSFKEGITRWENPDYLTLMKRQGRESWPKIKEIMASC